MWSSRIENCRREKPLNETEGLLENVNPNMWPCENKMFEVVDKINLGAYQLTKEQQ
jgi:hypothetical protein